MISGDKKQTELSSLGQSRFSLWPDLLNQPGHHRAENKLHIITSSSCTTASTSAFRGNVEKSCVPLALETSLSSGFMQLCCQRGHRTEVNITSPDTVHFSPFTKPVPELYKDVFNLPGKLKPLTETIPPFYILMIAKLSCQRAAGSASESTTTLRSWRSRGTPGCPKTEYSQSPQVPAPTSKWVF